MACAWSKSGLVRKPLHSRDARHRVRHMGRVGRHVGAEDRRSGRSVRQRQLFPQLRSGLDDISEGPGLQPGNIKPGDSFQYGAGVAFAVNERSSLSFSFSQRFVEFDSLKFRGGDFAPIVGSHANVASLNIGSTFAFSQRASVLVNVGAGLTRDTPDFSLATRVPFSF